MKKKLVLPVIIIILFTIGGLIYYVFSNKVEIDKEGGVTTKKDAVVVQEFSYEKDGNIFKFRKNRLTKTASLDLQYGIADKEEYGEFLGDKMTMAPFFVNFMCSIFNRAFFDPDSLKNLTDEEKAKNITEEAEFKSALEGYKISDFIIDFKDKESGEQIASCQSNQKGNESIKFTTARDYSRNSSFLGQKIGVFEEEKK